MGNKSILTIRSKLTNEEKLIKLNTDVSLQESFKSNENVGQFWIKFQNEYYHRNLAEEALKVLIPFLTTCLCENGFSTMTTIKNKKETDWKFHQLGKLVQQSLLN